MAGKQHVKAGFRSNGHVCNNMRAIQKVTSSELLTKAEIKDPAPSLIFVPGITNMERLTATNEQVVNRLNYTLKIIKRHK
jgi:hypothetical protein